MDLWEVRANRTKMHGPALTALEPLVFPRISTEIGLVLAAAVDGMLSQPVNEYTARTLKNRELRQTSETQ